VNGGLGFASSLLPGLYSSNGSVPLSERHGAGESHPPNCRLPLNRALGFLRISDLAKNI